MKCKTVRKAAAALLMMAVIAAPPAAYAASQPSQSAQSAQPQTEDARTEEAVEVLALINAQREKAGVAALAADAALESAAQIRAKECSQVFDSKHTRPDGTSYVTAFDAAGVTYTYWGENSAMGYQTASDAVEGWMGSEGHKANILNAQFTAAGVGYYAHSGDTYWVIDFIGN